MAYFCKNIEYILLQNAQLVDGVIVAKSGYTFTDITSLSKFDFEEKERNLKGNRYYEQSLQVLYRYSNITEIQEMSNQYLILKISGLNTEVMVLGSLEIPTEVTINIKNSIATLDFSRSSLLPESPGTNLAKSYVSESYEPPAAVAELEAKTSQFYASANQTFVDFNQEPESIISVLIENTPYTDYTVEGARMNFLVPIPEASHVTINYLIKK